MRCAGFLQASVRNPGARCVVQRGRVASAVVSRQVALHLAQQRGPGKGTAQAAGLHAHGLGHAAHDLRVHLRQLAASQEVPAKRVDSLLERVGLADAADRRVGGFSLGMGQRLGVAVALLGDPGVVILDEPVNGLDIDGVRWIRGLLRSLADEGRTVLLSSHLLAEVSVTADHLVVIQQGRLVANCPTEDLIADDAGSVTVVAPDRARLAEIITGAGGTVEVRDVDTLLVTGLSAPRIGELAFDARVLIHELTPQHTSLEDAFLELTESFRSAS